ncbi:MAG: Sapep family Mn(2+)-dependent dipeptidase [Clostridia bacterium]|nr:Sapep family Mn(2+)-dependent dipeptidase [Clostridia bacterium]
MIDLRYDEKIKEWIKDNKDEILRKWIEICTIPAIKGEARKGAPFGEECAKALKACSKLFEDAGFGTRIFEESGYALADFGDGEKTIALFGHSDVVPVGDGWIYTKPFEPKIIDGTLIGRGVEDNKSGIIASLCAMKFLKDNNVPIKSKIRAFVGSEEETGMSDIKAFSKEQDMPNVSLVLDADFPCSVGEKGICHLVATSGEKCQEIVDISGGEAFNVVLDKVNITIKHSADLENELSSKIASDDAFEMEKSGDSIILLAKGMAKHAAEPEGSVNAMHKAAQLLCECSSLCENDRKIMTEVAKALGCPFGTTMGLQHNDIRFGKLTFVNGIAALKGGHVELSFDTRYGSTLNPDTLEKNVAESFGKMGWKATIKNNMPGFSIDDDSPIPEILSGIYNSVTGFDEKPIRLGGGTYARHINNAFSVGTVTTRRDRKTPFMEMPEGHGGVHQRDEKIDIEGFFDALRIIIHYIINIDGCIN